jgi:hypothetical protein
VERRSVPEGDHIVETAEFIVPPAVLISDRHARWLLHRHGCVPLVWHVEVRDLRGLTFSSTGAPSTPRGLPMPSSVPRR